MNSVIYKFYTCDVFTSDRFGGNQLAVLPSAEGLSASQMQQIAREFNFSETTFVLPAESGHTRKVRIFTPTREVAFAGHPNIGTAFVLASAGLLGEIIDKLTVKFEEQAGLVAVAIEKLGESQFRCELTAPQPLTIGGDVNAELASSALSLKPEDIVCDNHPPRVASVGLPFLIVEITNREALARAKINQAGIEELDAMGLPADILFYTHESGDPDIRARMFAPLDGVPEDPATGSANCALAALLGHLDSSENGEYSWRIAQGVEMGRPSLLQARVQKSNGAVTSTMIGGSCVMVCEGSITV
jgi:trans-2,3-dihydro-3-hydroxyanthranilate isomerase